MTKGLPDVPGKECLIETVVLSPGEVLRHIDITQMSLFMCSREASLLKWRVVNPDSPRWRSFLRIAHRCTHWESQRECDATRNASRRLREENRCSANRGCGESQCCSLN